MARSMLALWFVILLAVACTKPPSVVSAPGEVDCTADALDQCEAALLNAPVEQVESLVTRYAAAREMPAYLNLWGILGAAKGQPILLAAQEDAIDGIERAVLPPPPLHVSLDALVLALARAAGRPHVLVRDEAGMRQLFPDDRLAARLGSLAPIVAATPERAVADVSLAAALRTSVDRARVFDYVGAAEEAEALRRQLDGRARDDEAAMRARYALSLLDGAGIGLQDSASDEDDGVVAAEPDEVPPFSDKTTPYAALLAVHLAGDARQASYKQFRAAIAEGLGAERIGVLDQMYGGDESCPVPFAPPMKDAGDLLFAGPMVRSLDVDAEPGKAPAAGKLALDDWLPRYDRLVGMVQERHHGWDMVALLLEQRGALAGLSGEGTTSYAKVTSLANHHVGALAALADAHPARFQTLGAVNLAYLPGVWSDGLLRNTVIKLAQKSVAQKLASSVDVTQLWEASITAFAIGMGYPPALQGPHFVSFRQALGNKLSGDFGKQGGWGISGLVAANGALGALLGDGEALASAAPAVVAALGAPDAIDYPGVARLVRSAAHYGELAGTGALDPNVSNRNMFPAARKQAREALGEAVLGLSDEGPASPPEKAYASLLTTFADGVVVALIGAFTSRDTAAVQCDGQSGIGKNMRDAFDRLQRKRKDLLAHAANKSRDPSLWLRRARLLALILSDGLDVADQSGGKLGFRVADASARSRVQAALDGWTDRSGVLVASSLYLLARGGLGGGDTPTRALLDDAVTALKGLSELFGGGSGGTLFSKLATIGADAEVADGSALAAMLTTGARRAYAGRAHDHGDLLLMLALGVALSRSEPVIDDAVALAKSEKRPVALPLLLYGRGADDGADPAPILAAIRAAALAPESGGGCAPPDPAAMIASRRAIWDFKRGERESALEAIERLLGDAEDQGLTVPRQIFRFQQIQGKRIFNAEQSISLGGHLLNASGTFQVGLGLQSRERIEGKFDVRFAPTDSSTAQAEGARYYAHLAAVGAVFAFVDRKPQIGIRHAARAVGAWANGVRLGTSRVPATGRTAEWAGDAAATIAIAAQLAADARQPMLAGDLWTLAKASLGPSADDDAVAATLESLPPHLRGIPEVQSVVKRAGKRLRTVAHDLTCTQDEGEVADHERVGCATYPTALGLRIADALPYLPRLKSGAEIGRPDCRPWRVLDDFLGPADEGRYEPDKFTAAVTVLRERGLHHTAATLLARQRLPKHCTPDIVGQARSLAQRKELGLYLRADLLGVAANCSPPGDVAGDLAGLDELTERLADPTRNFSVLIFASRLAVADSWRPLLEMSRRQGFVRRWQRLNPDLATAALLLHHAAAIGAGEDLDLKRTLPYYRLLCTTFPSKERGAFCNAITLLRGKAPAADKRGVAKEAVKRFVDQALSRPAATP
jgi:hypothetical protein